MNKLVLIKILTLPAIVALVFFSSCKRADDEIHGKEEEEVFESMFIEGLTINNYPGVDGSTSTLPLNTIIFCELLGIDYQWVRVRLPSEPWDQWGVEPALYNNDNNSQIFWKKIKSSQTHQSFINLIDNKTDLILSARRMSPDEREYAKMKGITLIETPIALDAFIFMINRNNPVTSLTIEQIQNIYTGKITNWNYVGGMDAQINPYARNPNSGSQELMESLVMRDFDLLEFPLVEIGTMGGVFDRITADVNAICYSVHYYREFILRDRQTKVIDIGGIPPGEGKSYPLAAEVYAVICDDLDKSSIAYKVYEFLQIEEGKQMIAKSGYLPYSEDNE